MLKRHLYLFIILIVCIACKKNSVDSYLSEAEEWMYTNFEQANHILDKIKEPEKLTGLQQAKYCEMRAFYIANSTQQWQIADSLISIAIHFYRENDNLIPLVRSLKLSSKSFFLHEQYDEAIEIYKELRDIARKKADSKEEAYYLSLLSECYQGKNEFEKALDYSHRALSLIKEDVKQIPFYTTHLARIYSSINKNDSAIEYLNKVLDNKYLLETNKRDFSNIYNEIAELYLREKDYENALASIQESFKYKANRQDATAFNLTKGRIYLSMNKRDSAKVYLRRAIESSHNPYLSVIAYQHLSDLYRIQEKNEEAIYSLFNHYNLFQNKKNDIENEVLRQKYKEEQLENENTKLLLSKKEREQYLLYLIILITLIAFIFWGFISRERKNKQKKEQLYRQQLLMERTKITEQENNLLKQENELSLLREKSAVLRESLFRKMSISHKIPSLDGDKNKIKETSNKRINLEEPDWEELIKTVDQVFNNFAFRLKKILSGFNNF